MPLKKKQTVLEKGSMQVTLEHEAPRELIEHMEQTWLGTPGGVQYHHTSGVEKIRNLADAHFLFLRRAGRMLGSIGYLERVTRNGDRSYKTWLVRYFSIKAPMRSKKGRVKKQRPAAERSFSLIKGITHPFHENPQRLVDVETTDVPPSIIFAIVEKKNQRSQNFAEISKYEAFGEMDSIIFSRISPRKGIPAERLAPDEYPAMKEKLREFYASHAFYMEDNLFYRENYYVLREEGEIVAGLQANEEFWEIHTVGSAFLDRVVGWLTRIPWVKRRFSFEAMHFLGIEGVYFKNGYESAFYRLLEGVLAAKGHYLAMFMLDTRCPVYQALMERKKLGPVHRFLGSFRADLFGRFIRIPEKEKESLTTRPCYISVYDNT